jgi:glycerophosphoryl diester phosphodiesterase
MLLGHRGARREKLVSENTLASFDLALAQGCDGFEFDVRLTLDGEAVICHDPDAEHMSIAESSSRELNLPLMREILTRYQHAAFVDIELKVPGLEKITIELLRELTPVRGFVISSFLPDVLRQSYKIDATLPLGLICETQAQLSLWPDLPVEYVIPHQELLRRRLLDQLKAANKNILVWTVNVPALMKRFAHWGVHGIISDHPRLLARTLTGSAASVKK